MPLASPAARDPGRPGEPLSARPPRRGAASACSGSLHPATAGSTSSRAPNRRLASTGGIDVSICEPPRSGGACVRPDVFDIDLYVDGQVSGNDHTVDTAAVQAIHDRGAHAVCYVSAGTAERFRPDYHRYVELRSATTTTACWASRSATGSRTSTGSTSRTTGASATSSCGGSRPGPRSAPGRGSTAIEYDVVDAYAQGRRVTGWRITAHQQLVFDRALAAIAHRNGLSVGLKNDLGQVPEAGAGLRLRDQRAVLPVPGVRQQPGPRLQGLHPRRQGGVRGRVPPRAEALLRPGGEPRDQRDQEGLGLLARAPGRGSPAGSAAPRESACRGS